MLSTAFFISAAIDFTISGSTGTITAIVEAAAGIISLAYWGIARPREPTSTRPLGIAILAAENLIGGGILRLGGKQLFFFPVLRINRAGLSARGVWLDVL